MDIDKALTKEPVYQIAEYDEFRAKVEGVKDKCNFLPDTSTTEGYEKSKRLSLDVGKILTAIENQRKLIKAPALERAKLIDTEAKELRAEIEDAQQPHKDAYKAVDERKKWEKAEADRLIEVRIDEIKNVTVFALDKTSAEIQQLILDLNADKLEGFGDRESHVWNVRQSTVIQLGQMVTAKQAEEGAARLAKEEADRLEQQRIDQEAKQKEIDAAAEKEREVQAEKHLAIDAENQRVRDEQAAKQKILDDQATKIREAKEQQEREEFQRQATQEAREAAEERERLRLIQQEKDEAVRKQEAAEKQARIEAQRPDKQKMVAYGKQVQQLIESAPEIKHKTVQAKLDKVLAHLQEAVSASQ